jgi:ABC-type glycerol-3-phosphate transport system permease component
VVSGERFPVRRAVVAWAVVACAVAACAVAACAVAAWAVAACAVAAWAVVVWTVGGMAHSAPQVTLVPVEETVEDENMAEQAIQGQMRLVPHGVYLCT